MIFDLAQDFSDSLAAMPHEHPRHRILNLLEEAIRRDIHFIDRHPTTLFQCMWNTCWWYDCPEAAAYDPARRGESSSRDHSDPCMSRLLESWRDQREQSVPEQFWVKSLLPPAIKAGTGPIRVMRGHRDYVNAVDFFPDGSRVASASKDKTVRVWDIMSGEEVLRLPDHPEDVWDVVVSPDGRLIGTACRDGFVRLWSPDVPARLLWQHQVGACAPCLACSPDGSLIASGTTDGTVVVMEAETGLEVVRLVHTPADMFVHSSPGSRQAEAGVVRAVAFSPDSKTIASGGFDCVIRLWESRNGHDQGALINDTGRVFSVDFAARGDKLVSAHEDAAIRVWDLPRLREESCLRDVHMDNIGCSLFRADGTQVVSCSKDATVCLTDIASAKVLRDFYGHDGLVLALAISPDERYFVSAGRDMSVFLWDAEREQALPSVSQPLWDIWYPPSVQFHQSSWQVKVSYLRSERLAHDGNLNTSYILDVPLLETVDLVPTEAWDLSYDGNGAASVTSRRLDQPVAWFPFYGKNARHESGSVWAVAHERRVYVLSLEGGVEPFELLSEHEALSLLSQRSGQSMDTLPVEARQVVEECGCLPLPLSICGALVKGGYAWADLFEALQEAGLEYANHRNSPSMKAIKISIDRLASGQARRFAELSVFSHDSATPEDAVQTLWGHTGGLSRQEASELLTMLECRFLVKLDGENDEPGRRRVSMHDLLYGHAVTMASDRPVLREQLLDANHKQCPNDWPTAPNDGCDFENICRHLAEANRQGELELLLTDFAFLQAKVNALGTQGLVEDYDLAGAARSEPLGLIQEALRLSADVLIQDPHELAPQLLGRLTGVESTSVQRLLGAARSPQDVWIRPVTACLESPGSQPLRTLTGHTAGVTAVSVTSDGSRAASVSGDKTLRTWDLDTRAYIHTLEGHTDWIRDVSMTPDGVVAISASDDKTLKVWDLNSGSCIGTLEGHVDTVSAVSVSPDGSRAVSASWDKTLKLWDLNVGACIGTLEGHVAKVSELSVTPDGGRAVSASCDKTLKVWNLNDGSCIRTLDGHTDAVNGVVMTSDGMHAVSASWDNTLRIWDLDTGMCLRILAGHTDNVTALSLVCDSTRAISASEDCTLKVWDLGTGKMLASFTSDASMSCCAITSDGASIVAGDVDGRMYFFRLEEQTKRS